MQKEDRVGATSWLGEDSVRGIHSSGTLKVKDAEKLSSKRHRMSLGT